MPEEVSTINQRLIDHFGRTIDSGEAKWRVVWSEDQFEMRYGTYEDRTKDGFLIREVTEWRLVPKYRQWIPKRYVLERLILIPIDNEGTLTTKFSYEPLHTFEDKNQNALPPNWIACKFIVESINHNMEQHNEVRYKDPKSNPKEAKYVHEQEISNIEEALFGNETETTDALAYRQGVGYIGPPKISDTKGEN